MGILLGLIGLLILSATLIDILATSLRLSREGGLFSIRLSNWLWNQILQGYWKRSRSKSAHRCLMVTGYGVALIPFVLWIVLIWVGWTLVFNASPAAVVEAQTKVPADAWARIYFTGYTLFTLGLGDYQPAGALWQIATAIASLNGFLLVTFSISYLIPVISAAIHARQLGLYISTLGQSANEILTQAWNGKDFGMLSQHFTALTPLIALHAQHYPAYPVLSYFHSLERPYASAPNIATLDEALTLLEIGVKPEYRPDAVALYPLRKAMSAFIETLDSTHIEGAKHAPPIPSLQPLRDRGIPTVNEASFQTEVEHLAERRKLLLALVQNDGWSWYEVMPSEMVKSQTCLSRPIRRS